MQGLVRVFVPGYRPTAPKRFEDQGIEVHCPRFLALPGILRRLDGLSMALCSLPTLLRLRRRCAFNTIDAHFAYPDGYAASLLGKWLATPVTVTLRGTESGHATSPVFRPLLAAALRRANRVFAVSESLRDVALALGAPFEKTRVVGNGVDLSRFRPIDQEFARQKLTLPRGARVLVSVGGLVPRKGFHRVIACLPGLLSRFPDLYYLVVGGPSPEGDMTAQLHEQVRRLRLDDRVLFCGPVAPDRLHEVLSAADVFILATSNEGWANVFLEAMACGLPVVTTRVGGNAEVVAREDLGILIEHGDQSALAAAMAAALEKTWDRNAILAYARDNTWETRVAVLVEEFQRIGDRTAGTIGAFHSA
jgi:glycosyltransferase involved in cell wall biosynthesis